MKTTRELEKSIRRLIVFFIVALVLSGITAFCIESELEWIVATLPMHNGWLYKWLQKVHYAVKDVNDRYPFMAYGYDWLAFAHLVIAVAFIGPLREPVKNIWVIQFGCLACIMIFPLALIAGFVRRIPFVWQMIDCSFGLIGLIPLLACYGKIRILEKATRFKVSTQIKTHNI